MFELLQDLWAFMRENKKFWLAPIIVVMVLLGGLIILAQGSAVAPFIYTLFYAFGLAAVRLLFGLYAGRRVSRARY